MSARRAFSRSLLAFAVYFGIILGLQWRAGAVGAGFGEYPDEPAHYVTGLMVHDYLRAGLPGNPLSFAVGYYSHLPEVAMGHWPPLYYIVEGVWMLLFGVSRASVLVLMALIAAGLAWTVFRETEAEFGLAAGLVAGGLLPLLPIVRWSANLVMTDTLVALLGFTACCAWGRYLVSGRRADALLFGVLAAAALLTKSSAAYVLLAAPAAALLAGRISLWRRKITWLPVLVIAVLYLPWWAVSRNIAGIGLLAWPTGGQILSRLLSLPGMAAGTVGFVLAALALVGLGARLAGFGNIPGPWAIVLVQPFAIAAVLMGSPVNLEPRYLIPILPPVLLMACSGLWWIGSKLAASKFQRWLPAALLGCGIASVVLAAASPYRARPDGVAELASAILRVPSEPAVLVGRSEGRVIAETAARETHRPGLLYLRATKLLADTDWNGLHYEQRFTTPAAVMRVLEDIPVEIVVAHPIPSAECSPHELLLLQAIQLWPERWESLGAWPQPLPQYAAWRMIGGGPHHPRQLPPQLLDQLRDKLGPLYSQHP